MDATTSQLLHRWDQLAKDCRWNLSAAAAVRDDLIERYGQPHRHYHTLGHIHSVLVALDHLADPAEPTPAARLAVWFHDAIYDGAAGEDEEASAQLAEQQLAMLGTPTEIVAAAASMVRATAGHISNADAADIDTALVLDADLSILAADPADYDRYVEQVRQEYSHVPPDQFALGRKAVVAGLLARDRLYLSPAGATRFEDRARENLTRELQLLGPATDR